MATYGITVTDEKDADLSIVIPAYNEEEGLPIVLTQLRKVFPSAEIIVVNDGSTDRTLELRHDYPDVEFVDHGYNRGYGSSLKTGMRHATRKIVAWFDADNEHRPIDLRTMYDELLNKKLVAIIAERQKSGVSPLRTWGKWVIRMLARTFSVKVGRDINCGLRLFRKDVIMNYLALLPNGYSASITSTLIMLERAYPTEFFPIQTEPRIGESKVKLNDGYMALLLVLRMIMLFAPLRIFFTSGVLFAAAGSAYGAVIVATEGKGVPAAALLLVIVGVLLTVLGLIADQISQIRLGQYENTEVRQLTKRPEPVDLGE